jgi:hypothetical protein
MCLNSIAEAYMNTQKKILILSNVAILKFITATIT